MLGRQLFPVPNGLQEVLREFALEVIRDQPNDILLYAALYFESKSTGTSFVYSGEQRSSDNSKDLRYQMMLLSSQGTHDLSLKNYKRPKNIATSQSEQPTFLSKNLMSRITLNESEIDVAQGIVQVNEGQFIDQINSSKALAINIVCARNLPLCTNATCEVGVEGNHRLFKVNTSTVFNNSKNPDWWCFNQIIYLSNGTQLTNASILVAEVYETSFTKQTNKLERAVIKVFRIPLNKALLSKGDDFIMSETGESLLLVQVKLQNTLNIDPSNHFQTHSIQQKEIAEVFKSIPDHVLCTLPKGKLQVSVIHLKSKGVILKNAKQTTLGYCLAFNPKHKIELDLLNSYESIDGNPNQDKFSWYSCKYFEFDETIYISGRSNIEFHLYDKMRSKSNQIGELQIDISKLVMQPGKWLINRHFDINILADEYISAGSAIELYIQIRFIQEGREKYHPEQYAPLML